MTTRAEVGKGAAGQASTHPPRISDIFDLQFNPLPALPVVGLQPPDHVECARRPQEGATEVCILCAPGHGFQLTARTVGQGHPHMASTQGHGPLDPHICKRKQWLWITRAKGGHLLEGGKKAAICASRRDQGVNLQGVFGGGDLTLFGHMLAKEVS